MRAELVGKTATRLGSMSSVTRTWLALLAAVALVGAGAAASSSAATPGAVPGARAYKTCAAAGPYWPTMTLALNGSKAWIACKERSRVLEYDTARRRAVRAVRTAAPVIAVANCFGSIWALESSASLDRINPASGRITKRIGLDARAPYNIWCGAGSVWVVSDGTGELVRISPARNRTVAHIPIGDGAADMVFRGTTAWVMNHRDRRLMRLDTTTNRATRLATLGVADVTAPERIALLGGSLWITGRGMDLLQVDPDTGAVESTVEIGGSGIDIVAAGNALWVPARSVAVDQSGLPTMEALRRVTPSGSVTTLSQPPGRVDVHGLVAGRGAVWLSDNRGGFLYRVPL
jgi:hypothetical protein